MDLSLETRTHVQRMQKALIQMNLHLHKVISDLTGLTSKARKLVRLKIWRQLLFGWLLSCLA
ncbi:hypothetical protein [Chamaesiphon sp. VAR_48_metabat_403]|uniref:hypothetical protein n=1 Tax=Chamaesiphon sp. VAR_48_metabat_403 TaxID=2964700 RepID=UPI00286E1F5C|nr:hypothetical protein [Chamaesiphon sp. VAR_48_metabat_403]